MQKKNRALKYEVARLKRDLRQSQDQVVKLQHAQVQDSSNHTQGYDEAAVRELKDGHETTVSGLRRRGKEFEYQSQSIRRQKRVLMNDFEGKIANLGGHVLKCIDEAIPDMPEDQASSIEAPSGLGRQGEPTTTLAPGNATISGISVSSTAPPPPAPFTVVPRSVNAPGLWSLNTRKFLDFSSDEETEHANEEGTTQGEPRIRSKENTTIPGIAKDSTAPSPPSPFRPIRIVSEESYDCSLWDSLATTGHIPFFDDETELATKESRAQGTEPQSFQNQAAQDTCNLSGRGQDVPEQGGHD
ncbi:hypothetical protein P7C71_g1208, partial [Lecanoromycetidae sp. Uapishka_2]